MSSYLQAAQPPDASATVRGLMNTTAQILAGLKTLSGGVVATLPTAGASDVVAKFGTTVADGSVNEGARLLSVRTGIGGAEKELLRVSRPVNYGSSVLVLDQQGVTNVLGLNIMNGGPGVTGLRMTGQGQTGPLQIYSGSGPWTFYSENRGMVWSQNSNAYDAAQLMRWVVNAPASVANTVPVFGFEAGVIQSGQKLTRWKVNGGDVAHMIGDGTLELLGAGVGVVLASPDGTRYRLTVTNAGALNIAAA